MNCKVYKSLDKSPTLFGIREGNLKLMGAGIVVALVFGFGFVSPLLGSSLAGTFAAIIGAVVAYLGIMSLQSKYSERGIKQYISGLRLPHIIVFKPIRLSRFHRKIKK